MNPDSAGGAFAGLERGIQFGVWWNVVLLALSVFALPFDLRTILGLNPWIKPIKFEISVIIFLLTMGMLLQVLAQHLQRERLLAVLGWGFGVSMIVENTIIAMQSLRGVRSHMNFTTQFDSMAFSVMGLFIALNTMLLATVFIMFFTTHVERPQAEVWGIRLGLMLILAASVEGARIVRNNGHTVGTADGGPGLPFLNWSTQHGDLRVAHFFALHGLQLVWLIGWLIGRTSLPAWAATALTLASGVVYAGVVWALFAAAMAGRALLTLP